MNKVIIVGRFTKEHDLKASASGTYVLKNTIAVSEGYGDKQKSHFFNVVGFNKTAELIANYTHKGSKILLVGSLQNNNYEKNGEMIYQNQITINEFEFLEQKKKDEIDLDDIEVPWN